MPNLPSGTVTFVFTDIEGSTELLKQLGDAQYAQLLATHRRLVRESFGSHDGQEIDTQGDAFFYSFARARDAVAAAVDAQRSHHDGQWPSGVGVRVRIGLHTGEPAIGDEGYTGLDVVKASRIASIAKGGETLLSEATRALVVRGLPEGVRIVSFGEQQLRDIDEAESVFALEITGLPAPVPRSKALTRASRPLPRRPPGVEVARDIFAEMPPWLREAAGRMIPSANRATDLIEQRVLAELDREFREDDERERRIAQTRRRGARRDRLAAPPRKQAVSDEIARLRELRDSGALTDEQYAKAVDRAIAGEQ